MRTLSADWMANSSKTEPEQQSMHLDSDETRQNTFYPRPVAPTAAQVSLVFMDFCRISSFYPIFIFGAKFEYTDFYC